MAEVFSSGPHLKFSLFSNNRSKLIEQFKNQSKSGSILIFGLPEYERPNSDSEPPFRQESCFYYLTGVNTPDCALFIDLQSEKSVLFHQHLDPAWTMWIGSLPTIEYLSSHYQIEVKWIEELKSFVEASQTKTLFILPKTNLISFKFEEDKETLLEIIGELRQIKSVEEIELIKYACDVNIQAIKDVLKTVKPGDYQYQVEGTLLRRTTGSYCRYSAFSTIVCSGPQCAILHYHQNSRQIHDGELVLVDTGCEYCLYSSDNTRTFPVNGKFSEEQKAVYQAVLAANKAVIEAAKPGVFWGDLAKLSNVVMCQKLIEIGLLKGDVEDLISKGILAVFYPHGLGHGMGLDVHEIAGWPKGSEKPKDPYFKCLRFGRVLRPGVVITVEPGCYFLPETYEPALKNPAFASHINAELCRKYQKTVGGVRIEDDILISDVGCINLSKTLPKEIDEIEKIMSERILSSI